MDYMDPDGRCPKKSVKRIHSLNTSSEYLKELIL